MYYDRDGRAITQREWIEHFDDESYKRVAHDKIDDNVSVSTVWLGIDHSWGSGAPVIFETMIFGGPLDQTQERYTSEVDALLGHVDLVEKARASATARDDDVS